MTKICTVAGAGAGAGGAGFCSLAFAWSLPQLARASTNHRLLVRIAGRLTRRVSCPTVDKLTGEVGPIAILCVVIALVVRRLPRIDIGHTPAYRRRRATGRKNGGRRSAAVNA